MCDTPSSCERDYNVPLNPRKSLQSIQDDFIYFSMQHQQYQQYQIYDLYNMIEICSE